MQGFYVKPMTSAIELKFDGRHGHFLAQGPERPVAAGELPQPRSGGWENTPKDLGQFSNARPKGL